MGTVLKTEVLYGIHPVTEALKASRRSVNKIYVVRGRISKRHEQVIELAKGCNVPIDTITKEQLTERTGTDMHQGIGLQVSPYPFSDFSEILNRAQTTDADSFIVLLDHFVDPHNLGAVIRTALCADIDGLVIPKDRAVTATPGVSKASAGALEHILLARVTNLVDIIRKLKEKGIWVVGLDRTANISVFSAEFSVPVAIVIGGEEKGLRPLVRSHCDYLVSIPQAGVINSLNASVAGSIVMYEILRQRKR